MRGDASEDRDGGMDARSEASFFRELYGFVLVSLLGIGVVLWFVPESARRYWSLVGHEAALMRRQHEIQKELETLRYATLSFETDPFYRESAIRARLGIKRTTEQFFDESETR